MEPVIHGHDGYRDPAIVIGPFKPSYVPPIDSRLPEADFSFPADRATDQYVPTALLNPCQLIIIPLRQVLSYLQASQLPDPLVIHPLLNLQGWDRRPYASKYKLRY